jgi:hypothetical protein
VSVFIVVLSYALGAVAVYDAWRRDPSDWATADRSRDTWLTVLIVCTVCAVGIVAAAAYAVYVLPGLLGARAQGPDDFQKRA